MTDQRTNAAAPSGKNRRLSIASLVMGIIALLGSSLSGARLLIPSTIALSGPAATIVGILMLLSFLVALLAAVIGIVALACKRAGRNMAIAGLVLGAASVILWGVVIMLFIIETPI